ncbi:hypothetical protein V2J09_005765 [Rumex salicifolius]
MEAATAFRSSPLSIGRPPNLLTRSRISASGGVPELLRFKRASCSFSNLKHETGRMVTRTRNSFIVRATSTSDSAGSIAPIAPLQLESPVGQFLSEILVSHPHLVAAAIEQQLDQLQTDLDTEKQKDSSSTSGTDLVLYRRIAEVKANERRQVLEEIFYALVVQKFMDAKVSLVPTVSSSSSSSSDPSNRVDTWPSQEDKLERLHSSEAFEMIQNHLSLILGHKLGDSISIAQVSKLRVGQVYAASIMYGYFLKRVDQRFQLEKTMKTLPQGRDAEHEPKTTHESARTNTHPEVTSFPGGISPGAFGVGTSPSRLKSYVMSFDADTLQRCATIRSKEAFTIIEKHTEALFGRPEIVVKLDGTVDDSKDELIKIGFNGIRRLVLEAVTFGSFLWDVESYVESTYPFILLMVMNAFLFVLHLPFNGGKLRRIKEDKKQVAGNGLGNLRLSNAVVLRRSTPMVKVTEHDVSTRRAMQIERVKDDDVGVTNTRDFSLFVTARGVTLFTQSWTPLCGETRGVVVVVHGLNEHSGRYNDFAKQLNAESFKVYALDWIGHGGSDGLHGYVHSLDDAVSNLKAFVDKVMAQNPGLPCFCFGHSTGGAIILKAALDPKFESKIKGVMLTAPAISVQPVHPIYTTIAPIVSMLMPRYQCGAANKKGAIASRDPQVLKAKYSDPLVYTGPIRVRTGYEILKITAHIQQHLKRLSLPFLVLHGTSDVITDPKASEKLYTDASSRDKSIKLYDGLYHDLLFEPERQTIFDDIIEWLNQRV